MSEGLPGWYPDPAGTPGRFRYWDGSHWSTTTTTSDPRQLPPVEPTQVVSTPPAEGGSAGKGSQKRRLTVIIGVLAVALTTVVAAVVFGGSPDHIAFDNVTFLTGFYSYGEISPFTPTGKCALHNQTMTITRIQES